MTTDLTFITNEKGESLRNRFTELIKDTRYFDCLVGYFYASGFYSIYKSLEKTEKIIIGGMTKNLECFYDNGQYLAGKSTTIILPGPDILQRLNVVGFWCCL